MASASCVLIVEERKKRKEVEVKEKRGRERRRRIKNRLGRRWLVSFSTALRPSHARRFAVRGKKNSPNVHANRGFPRRRAKRGTATREKKGTSNLLVLFFFSTTQLHFALRLFYCSI